MRAACLCLLLLASALGAAPPVELPAEVAGAPGAFVTVRGKTDGKAVRFVALDPGLNVFPAELLTDRKATVVTATKPGRYRLLAYSSVKDDPTDPAIVVVVIGEVKPDPNPDPKPVDPPKPDPKPADPLTSFRVILVSETGTPLTQAQFGVMYAKKVSDWLDANTTPDGWRRYDKDARTDGDRPPLNALWAAAKPKVSAVPCVAVERNGKVEVIAFEGTPEAMVAKLAALREGK
jgi:hypothetical protein